MTPGARCDGSGPASSGTHQNLMCLYGGSETLEFCDLSFGTISAAVDRLGNAFLPAFEHIPNLLDRTSARIPQPALRAARSQRDPISSVLTRLGSEQERQSDPHSKTDQQTQYSSSLCHGVFPSCKVLSEILWRVSFAAMADSASDFTLTGACFSIRKFGFSRK
jgi:hypothetical protein